MRSPARSSFVSKVIAVSVAVTATFAIARPASAAVHTLHSSMSGAQEVPPTGSAATGTCDVTVDDVSNLVSATCTFSGLTTPATVGHIHGLAPFGMSTSVILPFTTITAATSGTASGSATLTAAQVAGIIAGQAYTNIHSSTNPTGEIRGQIADFAVSPSGVTAYVINGNPNPTLSVRRGQTYTFAIDASPGHPFHIVTAPGLPTMDFNTGVTNNGTPLGLITFTVPASAPSSLAYQCSNHTPMTGAITVTSPPVPATGPMAVAILCGLLLAGGFIALRRRARPGAPAAGVTAAG